MSRTDTVAILAEDVSDAETLRVIVKAAFANSKLPTRLKGYEGCPKLRRKCAKDIRAWAAEGIERFIVCHDADRRSFLDVERDVRGCLQAVVNYEQLCCIAIPVQEIEAWIIADELAVTKAIPTFRLKSHANPESIDSPKEWLINRSRAGRSRPLYVPSFSNVVAAEYLRHDVVARKCASFRRFLEQLRRWSN